MTRMDADAKDHGYSNARGSDFTSTWGGPCRGLSVKWNLWLAVSFARLRPHLLCFLIVVRISRGLSPWIWHSKTT